MSKKVRQLGFCLLAFAAIATFAAPAAHAFDLSYTQAGFGSTMTQACNNAIQRIDDNCDAYGAITTDPVGCWPLWTSTTSSSVTSANARRRRPTARSSSAAPSASLDLPSFT